MVTLSSVPVVWFTIPGLLAASLNEVVNVSENVDGRDGADVETPPANENEAKGCLTATPGRLRFVVAEDTAAVETTKATAPAPARMAMARIDDPRLLTGPPAPAAARRDGHSHAAV